MYYFMLFENGIYRSDRRYSSESKMRTLHSEQQFLHHWLLPVMYFFTN